MEAGDTEPMPTPDENPHSRPLRALDWGTLVKVFELNGGLPGPVARPATLIYLTGNPFVNLCRP